MRDQMWTSLGEKIEPPGRRSAKTPFARRLRGGRPDGARSCGPRSRSHRRDDRRGRHRPGAVAVCRSRRRSVGLERAPVPNPPAAGGAGETVTVTRLSSDTVLAPLPDCDGRGFALRAGGARFSVPHDPDRPFIVAAGDVTIEDLGTTFTVRYLTADRLRSPSRTGTSACARAAPIRRFRRARAWRSRSRRLSKIPDQSRGQPPWRRRHGGRSPSVVNTKRRGGRCGRRVRARCATTPPICCWPPTPLA